MQCCGKEFKIGDRVNWTAYKNDDENLAKKYGVDYREEHHYHYGEMVLITGVVKSILVEYYDMSVCEESEISPRIEEFEEDENEEEEDDDIEPRNGFIVKLSVENIKILPLTNGTIPDC